MNTLKGLKKTMFEKVKDNMMTASYQTQMKNFLDKEKLLF